MGKKKPSSRKMKADSFNEFKRRQSQRTRALQDMVGERLKRLELKPKEVKELQALKNKKVLDLKDKLERDELIMRDKLIKMPRALMTAGLENKEIAKRVRLAELKFNELQKNAKAFLNAEDKAIKEYQRSGHGRLVVEMQQLQEEKTRLESGGRAAENLQGLNAQAGRVRRREKTAAEELEKVLASLQVVRDALTRKQFNRKMEENAFDKLKLLPRTRENAAKVLASEARLRNLNREIDGLKNNFKSANKVAKELGKKHEALVAELNDANAAVKAQRQRIETVKVKIAAAAKRLNELADRDARMWHELAEERQELFKQFWDYVLS